MPIRRVVAALAFLWASCSFAESQPIIEGKIGGCGECWAAYLENGWVVTAFHCFLATRAWRYAVDAGDVLVARADGAGPVPLRQLRCEPRPPERAVWRGRTYPVRNGRLQGAPTQRGDSGSPVLDEEGRLWGVVSRIDTGSGTVVAPVWPLCGYLEKKWR